jgi:hypothetical protein
VRGKRKIYCIYKEILQILKKRQNPKEEKWYEQVIQMRRVLKS